MQHANVITVLKEMEQTANVSIKGIFLKHKCEKVCVRSICLE